MKLCENCGTLMSPVKHKTGVVLECSKCGKKAEMTKGASFKITEKINHSIKDTIVVNESDAITLPVTDVECPECGYLKAGWWTRQTRSSDEPETRFYRCLKCKKTWREYS